MTEPVRVIPMGEHNEALVVSVHPPDWANPEPAGCHNVVCDRGGDGRSGHSGWLCRPWGRGRPCRRAEDAHVRRPDTGGAP